jgi:hypothetical protein
MERRWWEEIDLGTATGNDELAIFAVMTRSLDLLWLDVSEVARRSGIDSAVVIEILVRHEETGLIVRHPSRLDLFGEVETVRPWLQVVVQQAPPRVA